MKKLISILMAAVMLFGIGGEALAAYEGDKAHSYESADCTVVYTITNEWTGNQQISVSITNNSEETLRNWAIKFDNTGTISNIWNASVLSNDGELCVIRNNGYNYEIIPGATVEFGFMQQGENLSLPENVSLCSKTTDSTTSAEISYEIQNNWGEGFIAAVTIKNISDEPLEAWKLCFNGNFEISSIWNANLLYTEDDSFKVENDVTTTPIAVGETKTFSFEGAIASGEEPVMSDFMLTSIVIDMEAETDNSDSDETDESDETGETGETGESGETGEDEPTNPTEPTVPEIEMILCFGEYIAEEDALEVYWYSTNEGAVSVYENTDNGGWVKLAEVADEDSYKYEITEDFLVKHIKVKQETENGIIESEPFIVAYTEEGCICTWPDTDTDGLADYIEELYGTDPENPDTDSDGLSDYDELYTVGTSPLKYDTDEDGTNDADSDLDTDGLTNKEELELGTSPSYADTDSDELSDYEEIYETNTEPLNPDTDGDTLNDSEDIALGFDPNNPETFGTPDAEYKFEQVISDDSEVMAGVNTDEAPYELSLEITASGNVGTNLIAGNSIYSTITESDARLGGAVSLSYYGGDVEKVKLIYEVSEDYISNDGSEYAENCLDLQGIKRYNIFRYFEDVNMLLPVATEFDVENNILYAETDELGTYCVLDMEILLQNFGVAPDGMQTATVEKKLYSGIGAGYNVTFIIDTRKGLITEDELQRVKDELCTFMAHSLSNGYELGVTLYTQNSTNFADECCEYVGNYKTTEALEAALDGISLTDRYGEEYVGYTYCEITEGIEKASIGSQGTNDYVFSIFAQDSTLFDVEEYNQIYKNAGSTGVNISFITDKYGLNTAQTRLPDITGGIVVNNISTFADDVYNHIFEEPLVEAETFSAILATGYQQVELKGILNAYNGYDTDEDTLTDWKEVDVEHWLEVGLITYNDDNTIKLPTVEQCMQFTEVSYVESALDRLQSDYGANFGAAIGNKPVMPILSDPTSEDGDLDGIADIDDDQKLVPHQLSVMEIDLTPIHFMGHDSTMCVIKLYNGDVIWQSWFNDKAEEVKQFYITQENKNTIVDYYKTASIEPEYYYPWDYLFDFNNEIPYKISLRDLKRNVRRQKSLLDEQLNSISDEVLEFSDEYFGLWIYYIEKRQDYDEAGLLFRDMVFATVDMISLGCTAFELVDNVRQYISVTNSIKINNSAKISSINACISSPQRTYHFMDKSHTHLTTIEGFNKNNNGFSGGHTLQAFDQYSQRPIQIISKTESSIVHGVYNIEYKVGKLDAKGDFIGWFDEPFQKTVYDNTIISDDLMRQWAKEALSNGVQLAIAKQRSTGQAPIVSIKISGYALNGLKFEAWLDESTRMIRSYYPVID